MANKTKDFQEILHEVLNKEIKPKTNQELVLQSILNKKDKTNTSDFQEMLKKNIKPLTEDKLNKELKPKINETDVNKNKQIRPGANLDAIAKDIEKEKEEKQEERDNGQESEISTRTLTDREQTLKFLYVAALEDYYTLREDLYKHQIKDNNIALDDRNYLKLLQYEDYIRKCDTMFKQSTGSYISNQDEEISKIENKYAYDAAKSEQKLIDGHEETINEMDSLNKEIENKAEEIMQFNEESKDGNIPNHEAKLDMLEKEYVDLNYKMHMLKPNILDIYKQEQERELQDKTTKRIVGPMYKKHKDQLVLDQKVVTLDRTVENEEEHLENAGEKEQEELQDTNVKLAQSYIDNADNALENKDVKRAIVNVDKAKELVGNKQVNSIISKEKTEFSEMLENNVSSKEVQKVQEDAKSQTDIIDEHLETAVNDPDLSNIERECIKATYTPEERAKNVLARDEKELETDKEKEIISEKEI